MKVKKYVITGGPGTGKSTTIKALSKEFLTAREAARIVIEQEIKKKGKAHTWKGDVNERQQKILELQIRLEKEAVEKAERLGKDVIFMDRGIPDGTIYYKISKTPLPKNLLDESRKERAKYEKIFILEPIKYEKDYIRMEPKYVAEKMQELIKKTYKGLNYKTIKVPAMHVKERIKFIKKFV
mgnify:CR=1 FL=1